VTSRRRQAAIAMVRSQFSPDGKHLGIGIYYRPNDNSPWYVYGAIWSPGLKPVLTSIDPTNPVASTGSEPQAT